MMRPGRGLEKGVWLPIVILSSMHQPVVDHWDLFSSWKSLTCRSSRLRVTLSQPGQSQIKPLPGGIPSAPGKCPWGGRSGSPLPASWQVGAGRRGLPQLDMTLQQLVSWEGHFTVPPSPPSGQPWVEYPCASSPMISWLEPEIHPTLGTEIWEQKEELDLCKRPWLAQGGDNESVMGCQEGLPMPSVVTNPTECIWREAWDKVTLQWHQLTSVPLETTSGWAGTLTQLCVSSEQLLSDCTVMLKTCKLCMRLASY